MHPSLILFCGFAIEKNGSRTINEFDMKSDKSHGQKIESGAAVVLVLHSPREKCWGVLSEINAAGVFMRGIELHSFDDWTSAITHDEPYIGLIDMFIPMWRIERLTRDESAGGIASLAEQFEQRTGKSIFEL